MIQQVTCHECQRDVLAFPEFDGMYYGIHGEVDNRCGAGGERVPERLEIGDLRVAVLSDRRHRDYLWRSDWTKTLYRYNRGWEMFWNGSWQQCYSERGHQCLWELVGQCGERFTRVGQYI